MASRSLATADPVLAKMASELMATYEKRFFPWFLMITNVSRSPLEQEALYAQGRVGSKMELNAIRERVGLMPIYSEKEAHRIVTWTRNSKHNRVPSEAVDFAIAIDPDGADGPMKPIIDWNDIARYEAMGELAKEIGLVWGGDWEKRDLCHVELPVEEKGEK